MLYRARPVMAVAVAVVLAVIGLVIAAFVIDDGQPTATDTLIPAGATVAAGASDLRSGLENQYGQPTASAATGPRPLTGDIASSALGPADDEGGDPARSGPDKGSGAQPPTTVSSPPTTASSPPREPSSPTTPALSTAPPPAGGAGAPSTAAPTGTPTTAPSSTVPPTTAAPTSAPAPAAAPTTAAPTTTAAPSPAPAAPTGSDGAVQQRILELTNSERAGVGCPALTLNAQLVAAADGHAEDMAANGYFDHVGRNGSTLGSRVTAAGYSWRRVGENIAAGQRTSESVMQSWMNSSGHRANIGECRFAELGVGYALRGSTPYWVQVFASR